MESRPRVDKPTIRKTVAFNTRSAVLLLVPAACVSEGCCGDDKRVPIPGIDYALPSSEIYRGNAHSV